MATVRVVFPPRDPANFAGDLKQRVADLLESRGRGSKATPAMVAKTIILLLLTFGPYALILSGWFTPWEMLALAVVMGVGMAGIGFSIAHDALHGAYSERAWVNRLLGYSFDLMGANGYLWKITHNIIHHTYTNIHGVDEDLTVSPLLRLSPLADWKPIHRWQHRYGFFAYGFSTLFWVFVKDYKYFMQRDLGPYQNKKHPPAEIATLFIGKAIYYGWSIVIPLVVLDIPVWQFAIGYLAFHLTAGFILGIVFQLAHVVEETSHPTPDDGGVMEHAWLIHEMETTSNFGRHNRLLCWYVGGLNFQIEHHIFPRVCSVHYPAISDLVRATAAEYGIVYHQHDTLREAIRSHYRMLRELGRRPVGEDEMTGGRDDGSMAVGAVTVSS
jgi:linoleoyl-CoA desaturase